MKRICAFALFSLLGALLLVVGIEAATRFVKPVELDSPLKIPGLATWSDWTVYDTDLFWRLRPGIERDGERLTNRLGLRGPEVPPSSPDEFRILSLGESTTFARRLAYEQTYSALLERHLGSVEGRRVRVINAGVPAYTLFQGVTFVREHGLALEPDAILLYFGRNDSLPTARRVPAEGEPPRPGATDVELFEERKRLRSRLSHWLARNSNLFRLLWKRRNPDGAPVEADRSRRRVPEIDRVRLLGEIREVCEEHGIRLVLIVPWYRQFEHHAPLLRGFARGNDVLLVDLPVLLAEPTLARAEYFVDPVHPTAEGHALIAKAIDSVLRRRWNVDPNR